MSEARTEGVASHTCWCRERRTAPDPTGSQCYQHVTIGYPGTPGKVTEYQPPWSLHNLLLRVVIVYPYLYQTV